MAGYSTDAFIFEEISIVFESNPVPLPSTLILLVSGMLVLRKVVQ